MSGRNRDFQTPSPVCQVGNNRISLKIIMDVQIPLYGWPLGRAAKSWYRWYQRYREAKWFEGKQRLFSTYSYTFLSGNLRFILVVVRGSKICGHLMRFWLGQTATLSQSLYLSFFSLMEISIFDRSPWSTHDSIEMFLHRVSLVSFIPFSSSWLRFLNCIFVPGLFWPNRLSSNFFAQLMIYIAFFAQLRMTQWWIFPP